MSRVRCLRCSAIMDQRQCKVRCDRCGLFYDCSDGMLPMPEGEDPRELGRSGGHEEPSRPKGLADPSRARRR